MTEERLVDLEIKITHQEHLIEQLNKTVFEQQQKLDQLDALLKALGKRLQNTGADEIGPAGEKPPHY